MITLLEWLRGWRKKCPHCGGPMQGAGTCYPKHCLFTSNVDGTT